jgi:transcriptional regulator with XRE-family HTH domain
VAERSQAHAALGQAIRSYRATRRISQEELASESGLHRTYVGGIERGERNPSYANILKLADALGVSASKLLERAERSSTSQSMSFASPATKSSP